jgi:two-component sensor histidine kinase
MAHRDFLHAEEVRDSQPGSLPPVESNVSSSEANHRISNNLAILASAVRIRASDVSRRQRDLSHDEVSLILGDVSAKILAIAWLHRFLSDKPEADCLELNDHLYRLCETLLSALSGPQRAQLVRIGAGDCFVSVRDVVPLCLIVTEVVTNSLKYAHPAKVAGKIFVGCREEMDGSLIVEVADDGVGLPEGFDPLADGGTGARTIRALAQQLGAQTSFDSGPVGLRFKLRVPSRTSHARAA